MVERETGGAERLELGADFRGQLAPDARAKENRKPARDLIVVEAGRRRRPAGRVSAGGNIGCAVDQHEMQPDPQPRQTARPHHGVGGGRRRDHQARAGQDAVAVGPLDRLVDGDVAPEIVGADDQPRRAFAFARRGSSEPHRRR